MLMSMPRVKCLDHGYNSLPVTGYELLTSQSLAEFSIHSIISALISSVNKLFAAMTTIPTILIDFFLTNCYSVEHVI